MMQPGYRFFPTEEELITFYLKNMLNNNRREDIERLIPIADIYARDPQHLPGVSGVHNKNDTEEWFFFSPMQEREAQGGRPSRTTPSGYWKATGSPSWVRSSTSNRVVGCKKIMVFYQGRAPTGRKTGWKMNEYRALEEETVTPTASSKFRTGFSLCRLYVKSCSRSAFDRRPRFGTPRAAAAATASTFDLAGHESVSILGSQSNSMSSPETSYSDFCDDIDWDSLTWG
ncbi:NAC domain-containing protein 90 [Acorus calamus]|uniref:NAC domain-containing protein 90 n=1 Tax=Acorus calamus TaxID=4465 RepID=A0AAV9EB96_ACOCL|nr:NAC domain-containing protein 90 [Acorus calamus]